MHSLSQGCGAGTQISGSGSSSGHLNFFAPVPTSRSFWLRLQYNLVKKRKETLYYMHKNVCPIKYPRGSGTLISGSGSTIWMILARALAPAIQNCLVSDSWRRLNSPCFVWSMVTYIRHNLSMKNRRNPLIVAGTYTWNVKRTSLREQCSSARALHGTGEPLDLLRVSSRLRHREFQSPEGQQSAAGSPSPLSKTNLNYTHVEKRA